MYCLSGGQENSRGHVRRGNKQAGWVKHDVGQTHLNTRQTNTDPDTEVLRLKRHVIQLHVYIHTYKPYAPHTVYLGFYLSPLISSLFKTLILTYSSNDARKFPTHMQNSNLKNKTQRASGCVIFPKHWDG